MQLLYITYIDFGTNKASGSSVRPQKMYDAFIKNGIDVKLLECQQNRRAERKKRVQAVLDWLDDNTPDMCYIESPSGPIFNAIDIKLIKKIKSKGIPISYFYRDSFWLFPHMMAELPWLKRKAIMWLNKRDLRVFEKCFDLVYMPTRGSEELFSFADFKKTDILPPAADMDNFPTDIGKEIKRTSIYIGAVSEVDGTFAMIDAFKKLNEDAEDPYEIILITRPAEWEKAKEKLGQIPLWLKVAHASGDELKQYYEKADVAIFPRQQNVYIDISMPVKLYEYVSFGKPVISTKRKGPKDFVEGEKCGLICGDSSDEIAEAVEKFYTDEALRMQLYANVKPAAEKNQWTSRASKVINDLIEIKRKEQ